MKYFEDLGQNAYDLAKKHGNSIETDKIKEELNKVILD